jgi:hypothetical protein
MAFRISAFHRFLISSWLGGMLFVTACGTTAVNAPIIQPPPTCVSSPSETNPYLSHSLSDARVIYTNYKNNIISLGTARQEALFQLGRNTEHWSDQVNIAIDDFQMVRIVITYLDPVLIQYAVLNFVLNDPNNLMDPNSFDNKLTATMSELGSRNEMLFVVTITSPFYREQAYNNNVLTVRMPVEQLTLISSADMRVAPTHEDHILDESMDITHGPISGIVGYPLAVINQEQCVWIVDQWTNTLTLDVPSVTLGATPFNTQFWSIPYRPLVMETNNRPIPAYDQSYEWNPINGIKTPPTPNWEPNAQHDDTNWTIYWEDMGRYIWNLVITESHH